MRSAWARLVHPGFVAVKCLRAIGRRLAGSRTFLLHLGFVTAAAIGLSYLLNLGVADWQAIIGHTEGRLLGAGNIVHRHLPPGCRGLPLAAALILNLWLGARAWDRIRASLRETGNYRIEGKAVPLSIVLTFILASAFVHAGGDWLKPEVELYREMQSAKVCSANLKTIKESARSYLARKPLANLDRGASVEIELRSLKAWGGLEAIPVCPSHGTYAVRVKWVSLKSLFSSPGNKVLVTCGVHGTFAAEQTISSR